MNGAQMFSWAKREGRNANQNLLTRKLRHHLPQSIRETSFPHILSPLFSSSLYFQPVNLHEANEGAVGNQGVPSSEEVAGGGQGVWGNAQQTTRKLSGLKWQYLLPRALVAWMAAGAGGMSSVGGSCRDTARGRPGTESPEASSDHLSARTPSRLRRTSLWGNSASTLPLSHMVFHPPGPPQLPPMAWISHSLVLTGQSHTLHGSRPPRGWTRELPGQVSATEGSVSLPPYSIGQSTNETQGSRDIDSTFWWGHGGSAFGRARRVKTWLRCSQLWQIQSAIVCCCTVTIDAGPVGLKNPCWARLMWKNAKNNLIPQSHCHESGS